MAGSVWLHLLRVRFSGLRQYIQPRRSGSHVRGDSDIVVQPELWEATDLHAIYVRFKKPRGFTP
jgi:hypothetical protein